MSSMQEKLATLPRSAGVYLFKDADGRVIYVGKAKNLRARVRSYFSQHDGRLFYSLLLKRARDLEILETPGEKDALILENNLIKRHKPRYNVKLVDDKTYVSLRLGIRHPFPRVQAVRKPRRDRALYFGPYDSAKDLRKTLRIVQGFARLRTCTDVELKNRSRPCLEHQIGRCSAPCVGLISEEDYSRYVKRTVDFFRGKREEVVGFLEERMREQAADLDFEAAARTRDEIRAVQHTLIPQTVQRHDLSTRDVFGLARGEGMACVQALFVREGKLISARSFSFFSELADDELWSGFLGQFYVAHGNLAPQEIVLPTEPNGQEELVDWLTRQRGSRVRLLCPRRGEKAELVEMAAANARRILRHGEEQRKKRRQILRELQERLRLPRFPAVIECFDNSHLQGSAPVGSKVRFSEGVPEKSGYRHYRIKKAAGDDDFAMMGEVLRRRAKSGLRDGDLPDLILVDGGRGQLGRAAKVLDELGLRDKVMLAAIAKARVKQGTDERVFLPGMSDPLELPRGSAERHLLQRIRDAAHRLAIEFHRDQRRRRHLRSGLEQIPGVGPKRRKALIRHLGSLRAVRAASLDEISSAPGISVTLAQHIRAHLDDWEDEENPL